MYYAYQFFKMENRPDKINLYQFSSAEDRTLWLNADIKGHLCSTGKYQRQVCSKKDAGILIKFGQRPISLKAISKISIKPSIKCLNSHYLNIKPSKEDLKKQLIRPIKTNGHALKEQQTPGIFISFDKKRDLKRFVSHHHIYFGDNMNPLSKEDPILAAASVNGLIIKYVPFSNNFYIHLKIALGMYLKLNPASHFFALVSLKDWSNPHLFSFTAKSKRDLFTQEISKIKKSPILAFGVGNYHPIAVLANLKGNVFKGSFKESLDFTGSYLHHHIFSKSNRHQPGLQTQKF